MITRQIIPVLLWLLVAHQHQSEGGRYKPKVCQDITIPMCKGIGYNRTYMPNVFNHENQEEAAMEVHQFWPLVEIKCSPDLLFFLCSLYTPICVTNYDKPLPACRSVCERAKAGCAPLMKQYGFAWPIRMNCEKLPEFGDSERLCMDFNTSSKSSTTTTKPAKPVPIKPVKLEEAIHRPTEPSTNIAHTGLDTYDVIDCQCSCRSPLISLNQTSKYYNTVETAGIANCAIGCGDSYFSAESHNFTVFWIASWSILCCISTFLTFITFLMDRKRFVYPERPIILLSACYFMSSTGYILRIIVGKEAVACSAENTRHGAMESPLCTVVFLLTYYFGMAACIWWVILSLTWFLAAGLKWGQEAIASYSKYFHTIAFVVPAVKTIVIIAMSAIDGDPVSGICYVGNTNSTTLWSFVLIPLFIYLLLGISFLLAGFVSLVGIRNAIKQQGEQKIKKLEKLMVKIGIFSIIYTVPATVVIACHLYEQFYRKEWDASIACPCRNNHIKPEYSIFMLKYFMYHIVGITSGFWIWSSKTITAWRSCFHRLSCSDKSYEVRNKYSAVIYRRAVPLPDPSSTKSLCPSQV